MDGLERALIRQNTLCHYGTQGMKWYHRRYQNPDGSLTEEGRKRYYGDRVKRNLRDARKNAVKTAYNYKKQIGAIEKIQKRYDRDPDTSNAYDLDEAKYIGKQMTKEMLKAAKDYEKLNSEVIYSFGQDKGDKITYDDVNGYKVISGNYRTQGEEAAILGAAILGGNLMAGPITGAVAAIVSSERGIKYNDYTSKWKKYYQDYEYEHDPDYRAYVNKTKNKQGGMTWGTK